MRPESYTCVHSDLASICETCIRDVDDKLRVPETFYMLLDMDRGTLAFQVHILNIFSF